MPTQALDDITEITQNTAPLNSNPMLPVGFEVFNNFLTFFIVNISSELTYTPSANNPLQFCAAG